MCVNLAEHTREPNGANWSEQDYFFNHFNQKTQKREKSTVRIRRKWTKKTLIDKSYLNRILLR